ncbi:MAG: hypothetical protein AB1758_26180, partial [Candidatus Eremiobacterota bacterium]
TLHEGEKSEFRASVRLKPVKALPADDKARITVIADPVFEMAQAVMGLAGGMAIPSPFKDMRAEVEVHLVPYALRVKADGSEAGDRLGVEGDTRTPLVLEASLHRVDGTGSALDPPRPERVEVLAQLTGVRHTVTPLEGGGVRVELVAEKPCLREAIQAGSLTLQAQSPGGRTIRRSLPVEVKPLEARLTAAPEGKLRLGQGGTTLTLTLTNSRGKAVEGVSTAWSLEPPCGRLNPAQAVTDASGQARVQYSLPGEEEALKAFTGSSLPVRVEVKGPASAVVAQHTLELEYSQVVVLNVEKEGFAGGQAIRLELTSPGGVLVELRAAAGRFDPVAFARVTGLGQEVVSDAQGRARLGQGSTPATHEVRLQLADPARDLIRNTVDQLKRLADSAWATARLKEACRRLKDFAELDFVARLAAQKPQEYECSYFNLNMLRSAARVGELSAQLYERRFGRLQDQLNQCLGNLAGAFFSWLGEKYFPKLADLLGRGARYLFRGLARKLAGSPKVIGWVRSAAARLKGWADDAARKVDDLRLKMRGKRKTLPEGMEARLPRGRGDGPFRPKPGSLVAPDREMVEAAEQAGRNAARARQVRVEAQKRLEKLRAEASKLQGRLQEAEGVLTQTGVKPETLKGWEKTKRQLEGQIRDANNRIGEAAEALGKADADHQAAAEAEKQARSALEELKGACQALDELLGDILSLLNKAYQYGAWTIALALVWLADLSSRNLREIVRRVHPGASDAMSNAVDDLVFKAAFAKAFELGGAKVLGPAIYWGLAYLQGNAVAEALQQAGELSGRWEDRDKTAVRKAVEWYYEQIDAASFKIEETEVWVELGADLADWAEWITVWLTRAINVLLGVLTAIIAFFSLGTALPLCLTVTAGFAAAVELFDRFWDLVKAGGRSLTALASAVEVWAVVLPAHQTFTAKLYGDDSILARVDQGWSYPITEELDRKLRELHAPGSLPGEQSVEAAYNKVRELLDQVPGVDL